MSSNHKIQLFLFLLLSCITGMLNAQSDRNNPFGLRIISTQKSYDSLVKADSNRRLVDLEKYIPGIKLDVRYATTNNFTKKQVYTEPKAYLCLPVAKALKNVEADLRTRGMGLEIYDAYRPYSATLMFWNLVKDTLFVAAPWQGSRHNRGCTLDVTLINLNTQKELEMPTEFDDFTIHASVSDIPKSEKAKINRQILIDVMQKYGFTVMPSEWWHYDFKRWDQYEIMDIPFEKLSMQN
ncbi:MAG: M15 family metallopeptidase [Bacteroidales bacterium]|nr:M15 family metallopeptidase [Bacteroidales bacterium]